MFSLRALRRGRIFHGFARAPPAYRSALGPEETIRFSPLAMMPYHL